MIFFILPIVSQNFHLPTLKDLKVPIFKPQFWGLRQPATRLKLVPFDAACSSLSKYLTLSELSPSVLNFLAADVRATLCASTLHRNKAKTDFSEASDAHRKFGCLDFVGQGTKSRPCKLKRERKRVWFLAGRRERLHWKIYPAHRWLRMYLFALTRTHTTLKKEREKMRQSLF